MFSNTEYVYEVYKERSFSKAARNLFISQPALSVTIKRIESRIGSPIFDRSTNPIGLTECGEKYIEVVKQMMDLQNGFVNYLNDFEEMKTGTLSLGGSNLFTSRILPPLIAEFSRRFPQVSVNIMEANTPQLDDMLIDGELDLIIDNYSFDSETHTPVHFMTEHLLLAVPAAFPVNKKTAGCRLGYEQILRGAVTDDSIPPVPLSEFRDLPFILLKSGNDTRERALQLFHRSGIKPKTVLNLDQMMTSYNMVCQGIGAAFVSDTLIRSLPEDPAVTFYKLDPDLALRKVYFLYKRSKYVTRAMEEFLKIAADPAFRI